MNKIKLIIFVSIGILGAIQISCIGKKISQYELIIIFERPIAVNFNDSSLYLLHSRANYQKNEYLLIDRDFSLMPDIPSPGLIGIDKDGNYYISNAHENLKIFNPEGKFILKFDYPDNYIGSFSPFDENNNTYGFFIKNDAIKDTLVYRINGPLNLAKLLSKTEISKIDKYLLPPGNSEEILAHKMEQNGKDGIFYDIIPSSSKNKTLFNDSGGRYLSPEQILVYKFDKTFSGIYNESYLIDKIDLKTLTNDKVIYVSTFSSDKTGNIYISGVKSNRIKSTEISYFNKPTKALIVYDIQFFIWELKKND